MGWVAVCGWRMVGWVAVCGWQTVGWVAALDWIGGCWDVLIPCWDLAFSVTEQKEHIHELLLFGMSLKLRKVRWKNVPFLHVPFVHTKILSVEVGLPLHMQIESIFIAFIFPSLSWLTARQSSAVRTVPGFWCTFYPQTRKVKFLNEALLITTLYNVFIFIWSAITDFTLGVIIRMGDTTSPRCPFTQYFR